MFYYEYNSLFLRLFELSCWFMLKQMSRLTTAIHLNSTFLNTDLKYMSEIAQ